MRHPTAATALLVLACPIAVAAQSASSASRPSTRAESAEQLVAAAMKEQGLVGLSIAWIREAKLARTASFGHADREQGLPASDATLYRWASISKPVTAVVAMQLHEAGKLDLDADVRELVPEWPEKPWPISARQLLTHQGGVVHYTNGKVVPRTREYPEANPYADVVKALDAFADSPLVCEPGTRHSYTTHGYMLLGAVVQRAGGAPYWKQVQDRVAKPLAMSTFQPDYQWVTLRDRAIGYRKHPVLGVVRSTDTDVSWKLPGGGFVSNIGDLGRFGAGLLRGDLVSERGRELLWTRTKTKDGKLTGYALGFGVQEHRGVLQVSHSGAQEKTSTLLVLLPASHRGIALMCNTEGAKLADLAQALLAAAD